MSTTTFARKLATIAAPFTFAAVALVATAGAASADVYVPSIGDATHDAAGQPVYMGSRSCTVTAADPVVVTVNGTRRLRATNTVACNGSVNMGGFHGVISRSSGSVVAEKFASGTVTSSSATFILERACSGSANNSFSTFFEVRLDLNRDGFADADVSDVSRWNLRSCTAG